MPSRPLPPPPPPPPLPLPLHLHRRLLLLLPAASLLLTLVIVACLYFSFLRRRRRPPALPPGFPAAALRRFSYGGLRSATADFDPSRLLGRGASASVYRGVLPSGKSVAVKLIVASSRSPSPTSDLEFRNELHVLSSLRPSPFVVSLLGYCDRRRRRLLVYEYLSNGSLQEALFGPSSSPSVLGWDRRFQIILDVAGGLRFLHLECDPPVVHGDVKPSNVLLGPGFRAKIADFGLARPKVDGAETPPPPPPGADDELSQDLGCFFPSQELCSVSPRTDFEFEFLKAGKTSFEGRVRCNPIASLEDEAVGAKGKEAAVAPLDDESESRRELNGGDWWWKQEGSGELSSRDYVREWIGSQICPSGDPNWDGEEKKSGPDGAHAAKPSFVGGGSKRKKQESCADSCGRKSGSGAKEWWKEEYFAEMSKKQKCSKGMNWFRKAGDSSNNNVRNRKVDGELSWGRRRRKKRRSKSVGSEVFSGDLFSRELSSTATSMRGTICYVAPEHGGCGGQLMAEKTDIYSFGVLVLVIVSGRRPLHVLSSPMKLERANLVGWCRQLASTGNVLDLVDERLRDCFDREQANLCINLALLCLQKAPELRPDSGEVLKILKGEVDLPVVPLDFSPSPNSKVSSSKRRKAVHDPE